ncbi:AMP-binding protein [Lentzea alba]|uniref:AMP-binding protein n=1 Tax=Lentzea alba TaxID=2714351 RepID=UPI0039BEF2F1
MPHERRHLFADFPGGGAGSAVARLIHPDPVARSESGSVAAAVGVVLARHTGEQAVEVTQGRHRIDVVVGEATFDEIRAGVVRQREDSGDAVAVSGTGVLSVSVEDGKLVVTYDSNTFSADTAERFLRHVSVVLAEGPGAQDPARRIPLPTRVPAAVPAEPVDALWGTVLADPERPALVHGEDALSYQAVVSVASRGAAALQSFGGTGKRVAVLVEPGLPAPLSALAVLWARCAPVPLDGDQPDGPLMRVVDDADVVAIACSASLRARAEKLAKGRAVLQLDLTPSAEPAAAPSGLDLPVHVSAFAGGLALGPGDVVASAVRPGSPAFLAEFLAVLARGATFEMLRPGKQRSSGSVAVLHAPAEEVVDWAEPVRTVLLDAESTSAEDVRAVLAKLPNAEVVVQYGTAECPVALRQGLPVAGVIAELVDADGEPAEVYGEIVLSWAGDRVRTGDLAWRRADGALVLVGRTDRRMTIDGRHVQPEEIEAQLRSHPSVSKAVVVPDPQASPPLVAYAVATFAAAVEEAQLAQYLRRQLPEWSVPARVHVVPAIPVGSDGEVDFERLSALVEVTGDGQPTTDEERAIAEIWAKLLRRDDLRTDQHFVRLGGDSLQLVRMIALVRERFGTRLDLLEVLREPTIHAIAGLVTRESTVEGR